MVVSDLLDATLSVAHDVKELMVEDVGIALTSLIQGLELHTWRYRFAFGIVFCKIVDKASDSARIQEARYEF